VNLAYADSNADKYVSVAGTAEILRDREKLDELWSPFHTAWFPKGKDDPEIALIKVTVESAEYWNVPESKMVQVLGFAKAALTGKRYEPGEHGEVDLNKPAA
jgi:general stress protein 26